MANHKSALKRIRQTARRRLRNRYWRSTLRTSIKRVRATATQLQAGQASADEAQQVLRAAIKTIAKTASKGVIHRNQAARRISRLTKLINRSQPTA